jgi:cell wall-associated NlpC family hydrolase
MTRVTRRSTFIRTALVAALGLVALTLVAAPAAPAGTVAQAKARLKAVEARLGDVSMKSEVAVEKYNQASTQLETVRAQIDENQRQLEAARNNLERANEQLMARAENIYKSRDVGVVDVIFKADSFDDLISQMDLMERLGNSDVDTVHAITAYKRDIKDRRVKLEVAQKAAARLVAEREQHKNELIALEGKLGDLTKDIKKQIKRLKAEARLRAQLALTGFSGPIPKVDPNSPGHPEIVAIAQRYFGVPYVWGGASPSGFDCSGLTMYCYAQIGIGMSHGATDQQRSSSAVALTDLRPGDLIFFGNASFSHHVAIFVGGTTCIEAPHTGDVVRYGTFTGRDAWIGGRF